MSRFTENIKLVIKQKNLFSKKDKLLLALSGGRDSICLLHLLNDLNYNIEAAHVNYHLRDLESNEDETFVIETCKRLNIKLHLLSTEIDSKSNLQEKARKIRYAFFNDLKVEHNFDYILTAHHLNDQLETIFLNFLRGTGVKGLGGMSIKDGSIIRPILYSSKDEITNYCEKHSIKYRDDSSNSKLDYQRNYIRNKIIPELKEEFPGLQKRILNASVNFKSTSQWIEQEINNEIEQMQENYELLKKSDLLSHPMRSYIFQTILSPLNFSTSLIRDINDKIENTEIGKKFFNNHNSHSLTVGREYFKLSRNETLPIKLKAQSISDLIAQVKLYGIALSINKKHSALNNSDYSFNLRSNYFEDKSITVGPVESKDSIELKGKATRVTANKFLSTFKLEPWEKDLVAVIKIDEQIVWIPGYWKDLQSSATEQGEDVYLLSARRI